MNDTVYERTSPLEFDSRAGMFILCGFSEKKYGTVYVDFSKGNMEPFMWIFLKRNIELFISIFPKGNMEPYCDPVVLIPSNAYS